jgi:hypothetical protein
MKFHEIIQALFEKRTPYSQIKSFSNLPGIYAIYFSGDEFPDNNLNIGKDDLIYIGKTESSQASRDRDTHFKSGKTGSSTLRRTIGSLLLERLSLHPIPRNEKDFKKGKTTFFKFDETSEGILSSWMKANLSLSFYEYPKSPESIDFLETELIKIIKPIFNISKNPDNTHNAYLTAQRKACGVIAFQNSTPVEKPDDSVRMTFRKGSATSTPIQSKRGLISSGSSRSNPENKYTLHKAMEIILKELPGREASFNYLSDKIWDRGLYKQKEGGSAPPSQIKLRAMNYPQFEINNEKVKLIVY